VRRLWLLAALVWPLAAATPAAADPFEVGDPVKCVEVVPAAITPPPFSEPLEIRVGVLLDGVFAGDATAALSAANSAYEPLALRLVPVFFQSVAFTGTDSSGLIEQATARFGGGRPKGVDLVYAFTSKNMTGGSFGDAVAGQADCIGGVAYPDRAFAVGEILGEYTADIAGHEIGHLMGAHHHYANCGERICTLMFNDVGLTSLGFSSLNGAIVRGHAEAYLPGEPFTPEAEPGPAPEPTAEPTAEPTPQPSAQPTPTPGPTPAPTPAPQPAAEQPQERKSNECAAARKRTLRAKKAAHRSNTRKARRQLQRARRAERRACR
jgi:hypothetical protein